MSELDKRLREMVQSAYANAPAVKARFDKANIEPNDIQTVADLVKIPVMPKDAIVQLQQTDPPFGGMLGVPLEKVSHIFFSPGPIYEPAIATENDSFDSGVECLRRSGFRAGQVVLNAFSYHLVPAGLGFDNSLTRLGCTVVPGGVGNSDLQLKLIEDLGIVGYVGTPSFLLHLLEKAAEMGKKLSLTHALVTAEPLLPPMRAAIEAQGVSIGNGYATAEFGLLALNLGDGLAMQLMPEPIVEIVDSETGQPIGPGAPGEVVVTNFSQVYPLIRIGTGDMAVNVDPNPGQSTQAERAIILVGRSGEAAKVRGMFVHPNQLRFATGQIPGVQKVQGVVSQPENKDYFVVRVEVDGVDETAVTEQVKTAVQGLCRVRVDEVEFIPPGALGDDAPGMVDARDWQA